MNYAELFSNYVCLKCRGRSCVFSEVTLGNLPKKLLFRSHNQRYVLVTCELCGYTEIYSLNVLAKQNAVVSAKQTTPAVEKLE
ncbi:MAG TPA: zinc ribbon domain-containing protein [bacterium]|nr:hypothetical protein [Candidatus Omnitrophota bacterium]HOJ59547.1 zinc ribbon domain-containing protein [bacterium]HOL92952.1 zinc ribbon domain-containing protein [bacterium]HPO99304.1 zinc ribbon domain-containing protein [bacterium]HXK94429.1 zinc ribbon domain-containing protein [bacterium]